jgi:hypothetical protein
MLGACGTFACAWFIPVSLGGDPRNPPMPDFVRRVRLSRYPVTDVVLSQS